MTAQIIDGKALAQRMQDELAIEVSALVPQLGRPPGLGVLLVGDDPASQVYVRNKDRAARRVGLHSEVLCLPADASENDVLAAVARLNADSRIDGFLVQLPLPAPIDATRVLRAMSPDKDADGLHPMNLGRLMAGVRGPRPCTPSGVMALIASTGLSCTGKEAVIVGRSTIVGKPQALLLTEANATVTLCHTKTRDLAAHCRRADILVVAAGKAELIGGAMVKEGAVVVDVGIHRRGEGLVGDVHFATASERAGWITPVPGGVGPMTVTMLIKNAIELARTRGA